LSSPQAAPSASFDIFRLRPGATYRAQLYMATVR
jgi:hypothetical protein